MKVFVAGATGVLGWRAVAALVDAGHQVTGIARTPAKADRLRQLGATPVAVDLFDAAALAEAAAGHQAVMNLATHIPPPSRAVRPSAWAENDRVRSEGSRNLVDAAMAAGATRYVQESITFVYRDAGTEWIDEQTPLDSPAFTRSTQDAEAQAARFTAVGNTGIVLRFGLFYGDDSRHTVASVRLAARRLPPVLGRSDAFISSISTDDAASAVVAALTAPAGIFNVVDDEPVTRGEYGAVIAAVLGTRPPLQSLSAPARLGGRRAGLLMRSQRVSNATFRAATGWAPRFASVRDGLPPVVRSIAAGDATGPRTEMAEAAR